MTEERLKKVHEQLKPIVTELYSLRDSCKSVQLDYPKGSVTIKFKCPK